MTRKFISLCLVCFLFGPSYVIPEARVLINRQTMQSTFKATDKWKRVEDGEAIPPGLHVRFNLSSNTVEAKLMGPDLDEDSNTNMVSVPQDDSSQDVKSKPLYRNYQQIKESLKEDNMAAKSEVALMIDLVKKAKAILNSKDYDEQQLLEILADLNDQVVQIDVGREFAKIGAIDDVIIASLNKTSEVKSSGILLLGSALQNNMPVQIAAYKAGLLNKLLALIASEKEPVVARAMFALSALIRQLPVAQKIMLDLGGAGLLLDVFNVHQPRIQGKILSLVYDLLIEQEDATLTLEEAGLNVASDVGKEELKQAIDKQSQYHSIRLEQRLVEQGWCSGLVNYLQDIQGDTSKSHIDESCPNIRQPEHDKVEKALNAMLALRHGCREEFKNSNELACTIVHLSEQYEALIRCENENREGHSEREAEPDEQVAHYYASIGQRFDKLAKIVGDGQPLQCKDEL